MNPEEGAKDRAEAYKRALEKHQNPNKTPKKKTKEDKE